MSLSLLGIILATVFNQLFSPLIITGSVIPVFIMIFLFKKNRFSPFIFWFLITTGCFYLFNLITNRNTMLYKKHIVKLSKVNKGRFGSIHGKGFDVKGERYFLRLDHNYSKGSYFLTDKGEENRGQTIELYANKKRKPDRQPDLLEGISIGGDIPYSSKVIFRAVGLAHILAISGLHLSVILLMAFMFAGIIHRIIPMKFFIDKVWLEIPFGLITIWFYHGLTGGSVSTTRAALMATLYILFYRRNGLGSSFDMLGVAFVLMLSSNPGLLYEVSFQLSFLAVFGILLLFPFGKSAFSKFIFSSLGAMGATFPLILYYFGTINPLSICINFVFVPLFSFFILPLAIIGEILRVIIPKMGNLIILFVNYALNWVILLLKEVLRFSPPSSNLRIIMFYPLFWLSFLFIAVKPTKKRLVLPLFILLFYGITIFMDRKSDSTVDITFLSRNETETTIIKIPRGKTVLIDAGYPDLANYLIKMGITSIDTVFITHNHFDHYGGLLTLKGVIPISKIYTNGGGIPESILEFRNEGTIIVPAPLVKHFSDCSFSQLSTQIYNRVVRNPILSENDSSLVMVFRCHGFSMLFTGDLEKEGENILLKKYSNLPLIDWIKIGHHGHLTSSSMVFLNKISPKSAVIMGNKPSPTILSLLKSKKIKVNQISQNHLTISIP